MSEICRSLSGAKPKRWQRGEATTAYAYLRAILAGDQAAIRVIEKTTLPQDLSRNLAGIALVVLSDHYGDAIQIDLWCLAELIASQWDESIGFPDPEAE